jgi:hypothetical protein
MQSTFNGQHIDAQDSLDDKPASSPGDIVRKCSPAPFPDPAVVEKAAHTVIISGEKLPIKEPVMAAAKKREPKALVHHASKSNARLKAIGGSRSDDWNNILANQTIQALWLPSDPEKRDKQYSATVAALVGIEPKDELEGMMAAQLIAAHNAAMECYRRAMIGEQTFDGRCENLAQANKLSRTYAVLLDALNRHRGKGQQKVTVEHVHVHAGGQAVVGMVHATEGGDRPMSEDQPRAKQVTHAPEPTVWRADEEREPVPVSRDEERPLPNARRKVTGSAEGE